MHIPGNFFGKITSEGYLRPAILSVMVGFAILLSFLFLSSPDASSWMSAPEAPEEEIRVANQERHDIRLTNKDTFYSTMSGFNLTGTAIQRITERAKPLYNLARLKKDTVMRVFTLENRLDKIEYKFSDFEVLVIERDEAEGVEDFRVSKLNLPMEVRSESLNGVIENSLYEAGLTSGADPGLILSFSDIFAWDVDFASDIRRGDSFRILYETVYVEGRPVKTERILGAEMTNDGKTFTAIYFEDGFGRGAYYDADGKSLARTLLKSPLRYRRISSYFSKSRYHPISKRYRPHHGIDYAAPTGTPIEAAGGGRVTYAGWKGGYGRYIVIKHNNSYSTAYGHLSRIGKGIRVGARVDQGTVIGYVGSTGISTGPHLHYEVRLGNRLINPLSIKPQPTKSVSKQDRPRFVLVKEDLLKRLRDDGTVVTAEGDSKKAAGEEG